MAVQPWELESEPVRAVPRLELVPAQPRGGRVIPAILFVTLLLGGLGYPVIRAATRDVPSIQRQTPRPVPLSQLASLDPISEMPRGKQPMSSEPAGGILFVRCTNLWAAQPDGSHARKLLSFSGISSPAFSPDARTIAFIGPVDSGQGLFMVAADGSNLTEMGSLLSLGTSIGARITNLSWSENGDELAFALVDPAVDPWFGGSTIWSLDLSTGWFERVASGWPAPVFLGRHLAYSSMDSGGGASSASFDSSARNGRYVTRKLSSSDVDDLTFGVASSRFSDAWSTTHGAIVLRRTEGGDLELVAKASPWSRKVEARYTAPSQYGFFELGRVSVAQDASRALIDLSDPRGDRALGILDLRSGGWTVLEYAWSGATTPAPTTSGPLGARRAARIASDVLSSWRSKRRYSAAALLIGERDRDRLPMWRGSYMIDDPERVPGGWDVPVTTYGWKDRRYTYRTAALFVSKTSDDRVEAQLRTPTPAHPLETIEDGKSFIASITGDIDFMWPSYLPSGTKLSKRWPVNAYSYDGHSTATVHLLLPGAEGKSSSGSLSISYGDVDFNLGCGDGGSGDPDEGEVGGDPALFMSMGSGEMSTRQVIWPATLDARDTGRYSIYGELPRRELMRIASSMAKQD